jgi:outer membrane protein assembly factor BamD (BamD/ComL family)
MRRWLILLACGLAGLPADAQVPDPGVIAMALANNSPEPPASPAGIRAVQVSGLALTSSTLPALPLPMANSNAGGKPAQTMVAHLEVAEPLAPPPDPKPAPLPAPATSPMTLRSDGGDPVPAAKAVVKSNAKPDADPDFAPRTSVNVNRYDGTILDSFGLVSVPAEKDVTEETPVCFQHVEYLRRHQDGILAVAYLRQIVTNGELLPQYRARAILELADCLISEHQEAEALCWLKIWLELYPTRPEFGAVAYRIGTLYREMGLPGMARDAYYMALAHAINQGQVESADDLKRYTRLTEGTLWELAANEYQSGQWDRAAELFDRYRKEATDASPMALEKAAFLQADCYYQLKQTDKAVSLYEDTLQQHPFNPLAPQARLRLYHLYVLKNAPEKAREDLEALAWTVRTVWPKEETYWQKQTAQLLLALNEKNADVLPPLLQRSSQLPPEGKTWQEALDHYDALETYQAATTHALTDTPVGLSRNAGDRRDIVEETDLMAVNNYMNQLLPPPRTASSP